MFETSAKDNKNVEEVRIFIVHKKCKNNGNEGKIKRV